MSDDNNNKFKSLEIVSAAVKGGVRAVSGARGALKSKRVLQIRGGVRSVVGGIRGVSRFVKANTIRGLLSGEVLITEPDLNRWFSRVEPPEAVTSMSLKCRPSRIVLSLEFERRVLGFKVAKTAVDLPFEIVEVEINGRGGHIELHLDAEARTGARGYLQPILVRLLYRAAADLMEGRAPLDPVDRFSDFIRREGNTFLIDVGAFPPFLELRDRQLRLPGVSRLLPLRALAIHRVTVEEGQLVVHVRIERERFSSPEQAEVELDLVDESGPEQASLPCDDEVEVEVTILYRNRPDDEDKPG